MGEKYVPLEQRPEATFVASLVDEFLQVSMLTFSAILYCEEPL